MAGNQGIIVFTPAFIDYYLNLGDFPDSLVYMATYFATYDASMAQEFLDAGASVYMGRTRCFGRTVKPRSMYSVGWRMDWLSSKSAG